MTAPLVKRALIVVVLIFLCKALIGAGALYWFVVRPFYIAEYGEKQLYTCPVHPKYLSERPGQCTTCGMKLAPIRLSKAQAPYRTEITIDPAIMQNIGLQLGTVEHGPVKRRIRAVASVAYDESRLWEVTYTVSSSNVVKKVHVPSSGVFVSEGAPLVTLCSLEHDVPELLLQAPRNGWVIDKQVVAGQYVEDGDTLFRMADLTSLWVNIEISSQDISLLALGMNVEVTFPSSGMPASGTPALRGEISFLDPLIKEKTRTATARLACDNHALTMLPGAYGVAELYATLAQEALLIPEDAVLRSGRVTTVFVSTSEGHFEPRNVTLGSPSAHEMIEVRSGLKEGEKVVTSAQFLLDSESHLREAYRPMMRG